MKDNFQSMPFSICFHFIVQNLDFLQYSSLN